MKKTIIFLLMLIAAQVTSADTLSVKPEADLAATSFTELGYMAGYTFEGLQSNHEKQFHFPVPRTMAADGGELTIEYESSPQLDGRSIIRVDVNGAPRAASYLGQDASRGRLVVALSADEIQRFPFLNVAVKASLLVGEDRCVNDRLRANYLHLLPQSGLRISLKQQADSLRAAWEMLPKRVRISLPAALTEKAFANALLLARQLREDGKRVEFLQLPELGELIIAPPAELESAIHSRYLASEELREAFNVESITLPQGKDAYLLQLPDRQLVVFSEPFSDLPTQLFAPLWRQVALGDSYDVASARTTAGEEGDAGELTIPLERLGLDLSTRYVSRDTSWRLPLPPSILAGNLRPEALHLELVSSPSDTPTPMLLQVFLNGILQEVATLPNDGLANQLKVYLSPHDVKPGNNELHLAVQRNLVSGDCRSEPPAYPVQLSPNSHLVVSQQVDIPQEFRDLHAWFANGLELYVPRPDKPNMAANLSFLANFFTHNDYPLNAERIHFYAPGETLTPVGPFVLLGKAELATRDAGVRFDQGRVQVLSRKGNTLLDVDRLPHLTIAQLVQSGEEHGLWIREMGGMPSPVDQPIVLEGNSVAFSDQRGVLLTLNPAHREVSLIDYPEYQVWFDHLGRYRFWLLALGWLLLTLLVVHLYSKARQHRKLKQDA